MSRDLEDVQPMAGSEEWHFERVTVRPASQRDRDGGPNGMWERFDPLLDQN